MQCNRNWDFIPRSNIFMKKYAPKTCDKTDNYEINKDHLTAAVEQMNLCLTPYVYWATGQKHFVQLGNVYQPQLNRHHETTGR